MGNYEHSLCKTKEMEEEFLKSLRFSKMLDQRREFIGYIEEEFGLECLRDTAKILLNRIRSHTSEEEFEEIINNLKNNANGIAKGK